MILEDIEKVLERDGMFISTTSGVSMYPLLRHRRDTIIVTPSVERLKRYDVALYRRGDSYVLHRVLRVLPDSYIIRGDNCILLEHIKNEEILGKLTGIYRRDKEVNMQGAGYKFYSWFIVLVNPLVRLKLKLKPRLVRVIKRIVKRKK